MCLVLCGSNPRGRGHTAHDLSLVLFGFNPRGRGQGLYRSGGGGDGLDVLEGGNEVNKEFL